MSVESEVKTRLSTDINVLAILGERIYPVILPQNPILPAAQYVIMDAAPTINLSAKAGLYRYEMQIDIFARKYSEVVNAENIVRKSLQSYSNIETGSIQAIHHLMSSDDFEKEISDYKKIMRFSIWHNRENP
jgi:hypothetical protein